MSELPRGKSTSSLVGNILGIVLLLLLVAYGLDVVVGWIFGKPYLYCLTITWFSKSGIGASVGLFMFALGALLLVVSKTKLNGFVLIIGALLIGLLPEILANYFGMSYDC